MPHNANGLLDLTGIAVPALVQDPIALKAGFSHKEDNGKLFGHLPVAMDVKQGAVGDCYYLAAALSILHKPSVPAIGGSAGVVATAAQISGGEFIELMMKDHGDKTVTVRFFKADVHGAYQPTYVRVRKTFVHDDTSKLFNKVSAPRAHDTVWVKVLEKAWAAFTNNNVLTADYFENIAATKSALNSPENALASFLATDSTPVGIVTQDRLKLPWGGINPSGLIGPPSAGLQQRFDDIKNQIFGGNATLENQWETFLRGNAPQIFGIGEFRREDFERIATAGNMPPGLKTYLEAYFDREKLLPGKRGTGIYTQQQLEVFSTISIALTQRKAVELTSRPNIGIADRVGRSAGEPVVRGLVGTHAYAVLAVKTEPAYPFRKWVQIRNPWGDTGRAYTPHPTQPNVLKAKEQPGGEYWLELADVTKRFLRVTTGGVVQQL